MAIDISALTLPTVSPDGLKALDIISSAEPNMKVLEKTILSDPVLASTLIKYANSPLYRRQSEITSVPAAVRILGLTNIRSAVIMATMRSTAFSENEVHDAVWKHSMDIAMLCKMVAHKTYKELADEAEFLGLIHDLGMLILSSNLDEEYLVLCTKSIEEHTAINTLESGAFEVQHDAVMAAVAQQFRLPADFMKLLGNFHSHASIDSLTDKTDRYVAILDLAHHLWVRLYQEENHFYETIVEPLDKLQQLLQLDDNDIQALVDEFRSLNS